MMQGVCDSKLSPGEPPDLFIMRPEIGFPLLFKLLSSYPALVLIPKTKSLLKLRITFVH